MTVQIDPNSNASFIRDTRFDDYEARRAATSQVPGLAANYASYEPQGAIGGAQALPIPRESVPAYVGLQPEPLPPTAGYAGHTGQLANIAANFLHGYMEGRANQQARREQQARSKISATWTAYQSAMAVASNPDLPEAQRQAAAQHIEGLKGAYIDAVRGLEAKPAKSKSKNQGPPSQTVAGPQGIGGHIHNAISHIASAFGTHDPVLFQSGIADILSQTLPTAPPALSPQQQATRADAGDYVKAHELKARRADLIGQLASAQKNGNQQITADIQNQIDTVDNQLQSYGIKVGSITAIGSTATEQAKGGLEAAQVKGAQARLDAANEAFSKLNSGTSFFKLMPAEQMALTGGDPEKFALMRSYMQEVGPGKKFADEQEAAQQFMIDQKAGVMMGKPLEEMKRFTREELSTTLQNPQEAAKYGIPPLQAGQEPPAWLVDKLTLERYRATVGERADGKAKTAQELKNLERAVFANTIAQNPAYKEFFQLQAKTATKPAILGINPEAQRRTGFLGLGGESEQEYQARRGNAMAAAVANARLLGVTDEELTRMGLVAPAGPMQPPPAYGLSSPRSTPTPVQPATSKPMKPWTVTDSSGASKVIAMTDEEAQMARSQGLKVEQVGPAGASVGPSTPAIQPSPATSSPTSAGSALSPNLGPIAPPPGKKPAQKTTTNSAAESARNIPSSQTANGIQAQIDEIATNYDRTIAANLQSAIKSYISRARLEFAPDSKEGWAEVASTVQHMINDYRQIAIGKHEKGIRDEQERLAYKRAEEERYRQYEQRMKQAPVTAAEMQAFTSR